MILGLTGAIGSGKSAVLAVFSKLNWKTVDADKLCHQVYERASDEFVSGLKKLFGDGCVHQDGTIDRKVIADSVFSSKEMLEQLEELIIPEFEKEFQKFIADCRKNQQNAICEIPLLFEKNYAGFFDAVIGIWVPEKLRRTRLKELRNMSEEDISRREANQFSAEKKIELADYCIVNDGCIGETEKQIKELLKSLLPE